MYIQDQTHHKPALQSHLFLYYMNMLPLRCIKPNSIMSCQFTVSVRCSKWHLTYKVG